MLVTLRGQRVNKKMLFVVLLFIHSLQMTSKCGKNKTAGSKACIPRHDDRIVQYHLILCLSKFITCKIKLI